jgi:predicted DNA-binding protein with PD1-like motif
LALLWLAAAALCCPGPLEAQTAPDAYASPSRPVPAGGAPGMQVSQIKNTPEESVYVVIFHQGDEVLSGLTDFAIEHKIADAHFTAIGAVSSATLAWLDLSRKLYHAIPVQQQVEVLSLIGNIAAFNGRPVVHMHTVLGRQDGTTVGGHVFALHVDPTLEVFITVNAIALSKKQDDKSGMKLIAPNP